MKLGPSSKNWITKRRRQSAAAGPGRAGRAGRAGPAGPAGPAGLGRAGPARPVNHRTASPLGPPTGDSPHRLTVGAGVAVAAPMFKRAKAKISQKSWFSGRKVIKKLSKILFTLLDPVLIFDPPDGSQKKEGKRVNG